MSKKQEKSLVMEMVAEILAKLPVHDIGNVRCVCRAWESLIGQPFFIKKQLLVSHSVATKNCNHMIFQLKKKFYALNTEDVHAKPDCIELKKLKFPTVESGTKFSLIGSSNGLLCLSSFDKLLFWNPYIQRYRIVPKLQSQIQIGREVGKQSCELLGFGFVPQECDYKLVRFEDKIHIGFPKIEIYSLTTNAWKCLPGMRNNFCYQIDTSSSPFPFRCVKHNLYSIARRAKGLNVSDKHILLVLDMYEEKFHEIDLPETICSGKNLSISTYNNSVAVIVKDEDWDVWVMEETRGKCNWSRLHRLHDIFPSIYEIMRNGRLTENAYGQLVVYYDHETGRLEFMPRPYPDRIVAYNESLALLDGKKVD